MQKFLIAFALVCATLQYGAPLDLTGVAAPGQCRAIIDPKACVEVQNEAPLPLQNWHLSYNINYDWQKKKGRIIAYKLKWFNGSWSEWFVPGITDLDWKYTNNGGTKQVRRMWSYFNDHYHTYIICY